MFTKETQELAKPCVEAIKKISKGKWEWEPEWGDNFILQNALCIFHYTEKDRVYFVVDTWKELQDRPSGYFDDVSVSLLHWERIEEILEGMGYDVFVIDQGSNGEMLDEYVAEIWKPAPVDCRKERPWIDGTGKTRQLAVMRAVIELTKENKC